MSDVMKQFNQATDAMTRLYIFGAIIGILESGSMTGGSPSADKATQKLIKICKEEMRKQLAIHDAGRSTIINAAKGIS